MLSAVFKFKLPELSDHHAIRSLLRSFAIERPRGPLSPPSWDLDLVLKHLMSDSYEPLSLQSLRIITKKTLFLISLATAKRIGELQALSRVVSSQGADFVLTYQPHFLAKTERADRPLPCSFTLKSLKDCWRLRGRFSSMSCTRLAHLFRQDKEWCIEGLQFVCVSKLSYSSHLEECYLLFLKRSNLWCWSGQRS